ncbi:MAG TPA: TIGR00282 family metallophosphoesterase [Candidatus Latescibacteria bacterium]|nr:TIGR00282 family metallophosphoesterase [Candidatus Latescibacterota bacterium]
MNILFVADICGRPGRRIAAELIPHLIKRYDVELCIANGENAAGGTGITEKIAEKIHTYGVHVITSGNHVWDKKDALPYIERAEYLIRPANYPPGVEGKGSVIFQTKSGTLVGVLNLQGRTYIRELDCPFRVGQREIEKLREVTNIIIVDFHAEATSEKMALGWYLNGKVTAVIGTHTHVQTCDETILPGGTAYITDAGMTGPHDSVIGVQKEAAIRRFLLQIPVKLRPATNNLKLCGVLIEADESTGKARKIERVRMDYPDSSRQFEEKADPSDGE